MIGHGIVIGMALAVILTAVTAYVSMGTPKPLFAGLEDMGIVFPSANKVDTNVKLMSEGGDGSAAEAEYEPKSWLSAALGLDKHPATLATINNTLRTVGAAAGLPTSLIGVPNATAADPTGTGSTLGESGTASTPSTLLAALEDAGVSVGVPALKTIVAQLALKVPDLTTQEQADLTTFTDDLIDNVAAGITKTATTAPAA